MEGLTEQVTPAAPAGDAGSSPASGTDLGAATGALAPSAETQAAPTQTTANSGNDAAPGAPADQPNAAQPSESEPDPYALTPQEAQARTIGRDRFDSLLTGYKSLETDHRALKTQWETAQEKLAAFDVVGGLDDAAQLLSSLTSYATDPQTGQPLLDANGQPYYDTTGFVTRLNELDQSALIALTYDAMQMPFGDGRTVGEAWAEQLGWQTQPQAMQSPSQPVASANPEAVALVKEVFPQQAGEFEQAFKSLSPTVQKTVSDLLNQNSTEADAEARQILQKEHGNLQTQQFMQQQRAEAERRVQFGLQQFDQQLREHVTTQAHSDTQAALAEISKQLDAQVAFSADPLENTFQKTAVNAFLAALTNPATRFTVEPILQQIGAQLPPGFWERYANYSGAFETYHVHSKRVETIRQNADLAPHLSRHRNDAEMNRAKSAMDRERRFVVAGLNDVALKVAKMMAGQLEQAKSVGAAISATQSSRPNVNGQAGVNGNAPLAALRLPDNIRPFTPEAIAWAREQRQGA